MTRLSRIHPYPAMIADRLAERLAEQFVQKGQRVLDPFCGTSRTLLAAADRGADCLGIDVNPLAVLLTRAKGSHPSPERMRRLLANLSDSSRCPGRGSTKDIEPGRKVEWFSRKTRDELSALLDRLNSAHLRRDDLYFVAAVLGATVREVCYCRKDQWKLHRLPRRIRASFFKSPWVVFERRLRSALRELNEGKELIGSVEAITGDARRLSHLVSARKGHKNFDVVITSPPYGDSRTTVQYGGMSAISLGVLAHLHGLDVEIMTGGEIDRHCLGGHVTGPKDSEPDELLLSPKYWRGGIRNPARERVRCFLADVDRCCDEIAKVLCRGGRAVFVVACRSIGGWRLHLDRYLIDALSRRDLRMQHRWTRRIMEKLTPNVINCRGRAAERDALGDRVVTMRNEHIIAFRKP